MQVLAGHGTVFLGAAVQGEDRGGPARRAAPHRPRIVDRLPRIGDPAACGVRRLLVRRRSTVGRVLGGRAPSARRTAVLAGHGFSSGAVTHGPRAIKDAWTAAVLVRKGADGAAPTGYSGSSFAVRRP